MTWIHRLKLVIAALMLLAGWCAVGAAETDQLADGLPGAPSDDQVAAARQAVARFMTAVDQADRQALGDAIYCDFNITAQKQGLLALIDCIVYQRELEKAISARWGNQAARAITSLTTFSRADHDSSSRARVERRDSGDLLVILPPPQSPIVVRHGADGRWRVHLRVVWTLFDSVAVEHVADRPPHRLPEPGSRRQIEYMRGVARILDRSAKAIKAGDFATPADANAALQQALDNARTNPPGYERSMDGAEDERPFK